MKSIDTLKKGKKVRCPNFGSGWATVIYVNPHTGRVEIIYPGAGYAIEVDATDLETQKQ
jgi:hypothetical protein